MASKNKHRQKLVTPKARASRALLHAKETSCRLTESISSSKDSDSGTDDDLDIDARKLKKDRKRKAENQRRYYYRQVNASTLGISLLCRAEILTRHQEAERTKARNRAVL